MASAYIKSKGAGFENVFQVKLLVWKQEEVLINVIDLHSYCIHTL